MKMRTKITLLLAALMVSMIFSCSKESTTEPDEPKPENILPICIISNLYDNSSFVLGDTLEILVTADDEDGQVTQVNFFIDDQLRHTDSEKPFSFLWETSGETLGQHVIRAEAMDDSNATGLFSLITVTLTEEENQPPSCTISNLSDSTILTGSDTLSIDVDASDEDGQVSHVKFYIDGQLRHTDFASPFNFQWNTSGETYGRHVITALAVDDDGAFATAVAKVYLTWEYHQPEQLYDGWETAALQNVGFDSIHLYNLMNTLYLYNNENHRVHGIVICRYGKLVFEEYFYGFHRRNPAAWIQFDRDHLHILASVTKSFTSALLGIAIDQGFIESVDTPVSEFFPNIEDLDQGQKADITIEHMITMSSGLQWDQSTYPINDHRNDIFLFYSNPDPWKMYLSRPLASIPGAQMNYSEASINVIGECIRRSSGLKLDQFADKYLFNTLGISDRIWSITLGGWFSASGDLFLRPRDMLKLGQLYLQGGSWEGEQVVPELWVEASFVPYFIFDSNFSAHEQYWASHADMNGYSYAWWTLLPETYGENAYTASGWGGQRIMILPEYDMVIAFTGGSEWEAPLLTPHEMMIRYILPSIQ